MRKRGGQTRFTHALADRICTRLAEGESLLEICRDEDLPPESTVRGWVVDNRCNFAAKYTRARDLGLDHEADEIKAIADTCRVGQKIEEKEISRRCSVCLKDLRWLGGWKHTETFTALCENAEVERVVELKTVTADMVERAKLQVDARKWRLSKMLPKRYGDRVELAGDSHGGPAINLIVNQAGARAKENR